MEPQKQLFRKYLFFSFIFTIFFIFLTLSAYKGQLYFLKKIDLLFYDSYFNWRGPLPTSGKVTVVLMDEKSASELNREKNYWSRSQMAEAVRHLSAAGARVIGLDIVFFAPSPEPAEDRMLANAITDSGRVVLARYSEGRGETVALPVFQEGMVGDGFVNFNLDPDDVLRRLQYFSGKKVKEGLDLTPDFSLEIVRAYLNLDFIIDFSALKTIAFGDPGPHQIHLPNPELLIRYYGGPDAFANLFYADVVKNRFDPSLVKDKIVLVGSSLTTDKDFYPTPFAWEREKIEIHKNQFGELMNKNIVAQMPGVVCHANAIETLLQRTFILKPGTGYIILSIILAGLLGLVFCFQKPGPLWGVIILALGGSGVVGAAYYVFVHHLLWIEIAPLLSVWSIQYVSGVALQRSYHKSREKFVSSVFGKYVSQRVVDDILKGQIHVSLEGRSQELTILFADLRNFTTISERLSPQETQQLLNVFFDAMLPIVLYHEGTLDKLMGDAIMAFFGDPRTLADHPQQAAKTALEMLVRLDQLKREKPGTGIHLLQMGIGINTGMVTVGNLGSSHFMNYTVIGDTVNLASRLEGLNKIYGTSILLTEATAEQLSPDFALRELDQVRVKGKMDAVKIFELVGLRSELDQCKLDLLSVFKTGVAQYRQQAWTEAARSFTQALAMDPQDEPSRIYQGRLTELLRDPPPADWSPVITFISK